jgi:chemotaxis signal transduction protein
MVEAVHVRVGAGRYAFDVADVREVEERLPVTAVPGAPAAIAGVGNLRGAVLPIIELDAVLGHGGDGGRFIVVADAGGMVAGLAVDEILGVEELPRELDPDDTPGVRGHALVDGELIGVLDAVAILHGLAEIAEG